MRKNIIVVDDFYNNPKQVRSFALDQDFYIKGNYPGKRTEAPTTEKLARSLMNTFSSLIGERLKPWDLENLEYNGAYQITLEDDETWIHTDGTRWACIVYLTPDAPLSSGTAFYRIPQENLYCREDRKGKDHNNLDPRWIKADVIANVFNRAVIYRGDMYHRSDLPGFGNTLYTGRLFQTFFFDTEN